MDGYAFIAFHGSWNRDVPTGHTVVYARMNESGHVAAEPIDLLAHIPLDAHWEDGFRPVDADFDACGRLLVASDGSNEGSKVVRIEYLGCDETGQPASSFAPSPVLGPPIDSPVPFQRPRLGDRTLLTSFYS